MTSPNLPPGRGTQPISTVELAGETAGRIDDLGQSLPASGPQDSKVPHKLGVWRATAICGNDITSSALYVAALCAIYAGPYAPISLALVAAVLYLFRNVYAEVGSALPLNGGAYNVLLNTTSKAKASVAACLTILSYIATAVLSANEAMHYANNFLPGLNVIIATVVLLGFFAALNLMGITESAVVALIIFVTHLATLTVLAAACLWAVSLDTSLFQANWHLPPPGGFGRAIFFGFSAAMLGISGFESSANFIEEQGPGVFPKTLRNMWIAVAIFNPLISVLAMGLVPLGEIVEHENDLLAHMGTLSAGRWLQQAVSLDATLVLSGAVLTSYVGVKGLVHRMSLDRCLPQFLLKQNRWRGTHHWIILLFFLLCCSILLITAGNIQVLAGVYTLSFLGVMSLFAVGNMLLKVTRARLPREVRADWGAVVIGLAAVIAALLGNALLHPDYVPVFVLYFVICFSGVALMILRVEILRVILVVIQTAIAKIGGISRNLNLRILRRVDEIRALQVIYFTRGDDLAALNRAALYVLANEHTKNMKFVHCFEREEDISQALAENLRIIDRIYPTVKIDLMLVKGKFGPDLIERLSKRLGVPKNYMFIGTPGDRFPHNIAELGGVRLIL